MRNVLLRLFLGILCCQAFTNLGTKAGEYVIYTVGITGRKLCQEECDDTASCVSIVYNKEELSCDLIGNSQITSKSASGSCPERQRFFKLTNDSTVCITTDCGVPYTDSTLINVTQSSTIDGSKAIFSCKDGYDPKNVTMVSTCLTSGAWESVSLVCEGLTYALFDFEGDDPYHFLIRTGPPWYIGNTGDGPSDAPSRSYYLFTEWEPSFDEYKGMVVSEVYFSHQIHCLNFSYYLYEYDIWDLAIYFESESYTQTTNRIHLTDFTKYKWIRTMVHINNIDNFKFGIYVEFYAYERFSGVAIDYIELTKC